MSDCEEWMAVSGESTKAVARTRTLTAWGFLAFFAWVGALAYVGDRYLFWVYVAAFVPLVLLHAFYVCPRCTNTACGFNPACPNFLIGRPLRDPPPEGRYSDHSLLLTAVPMSVAGTVGLVGAWKGSPAMTLLGLGVVAVVHVFYRRHTCRHCGNRCPGNTNPEYWAWKQPGSKRARGAGAD